MFRVLSAGRVIVPLALVAVLASPTPSLGQMSGRLRGRVVDMDGQPVEGATVTLEFQGISGRRLEGTTDSGGRFIQIGLQAGGYSVTAEKEGVGRRSETVTLRVGQQLEVDLILVPAGMRDINQLSDEERAEYEAEMALRPILEAALAASQAGNADEAIAKYEEALVASPGCVECHHGIGLAYAKKEDYASAEAAFNRALEVSPDYAPAFTGLASIYNAQRRFDDAAKASQRAAELGGGAAGGSDANAVFSQGLINWNAGNTEEAKAQFLKTLELDPGHGEAHYWLGMANLNEGKVAEAKAEFQRYVEVEPDGRFAEQTAGMLTQLP